MSIPAFSIVGMVTKGSKYVLEFPIEQERNHNLMKLQPLYFNNSSSVTNQGIHKCSCIQGKQPLHSKGTKTRKLLCN